MINGVEIKKLKVFPDRRGHSMEMLRCDDGMYDKFGQMQLSTMYPGAIMGWCRHERNTDKVVCVKGMVKLVMFDDREDSSTRGELMEVSIGEHKPVLVHIPAGIYHGWKCISEVQAYVINTCSEPVDHDNPDVSRLPYDSPDIPYDWEIKMG
ncbi:MAG: dTDP-4-dehydrorhamnose 3,5-epimerase family protein [Actinobacteria bacterium]|nr:dTDP-4-dehydrorhamnose 3,5-epimerase family protein [Actinomycetota bacterium]